MENDAFDESKVVKRKLRPGESQFEPPFDPLAARGTPRVEIAGHDPHCVTIDKRMFDDLVIALKKLGVTCQAMIVDDVVRNIELGRVPCKGGVTIVDEPMGNDHD